MKNLYLIKFVLLLVLFIFLSKEGISQIEGEFNPCPGKVYKYKDAQGKGKSCRWTVTSNGYFTNSTGSDNYGGTAYTDSVYVKWATTQTLNKITIYIASTDPTESKDIKIKYIYQPQFIPDTLNIDYVTTSKTINVVPVMDADSYQWELPAGGYSHSDVTGMDKNFQNITFPNSLHSFTVKCKAVACTYASSPATLTVKRYIPKITIQKDLVAVKCGDKNPLTFEVTPNLPQAVYTWSLPPGWTGPTTTSTNSITVIPNGENVGALSVIATVTDGDIIGTSSDLANLSFSPLPNLPISGSQVLCNNISKMYTAIGGPPYNVTYKWESSNNLLINGQTSPYYTSSNTVSVSSPVGYGEATLSVSYTSCNLSSNITSQSIWIGLPDDRQIQMGVVNTLPPNDKVVRNQNVTIMASHPLAGPRGITAFQWYFAGWTPYLNGYEIGTGTVYHDRPIINLTNSASSQQIVMVAAENECGCGMDELIGQAKMFYAVNGGMFMSISPNPASSDIEVSLSAEATPQLAIQSTAPVQYDIKVFDFFGTLIYSSKKNQTKFKIQTAGFHDGVYFLMVSDGKKSVRQQFIIKH